MNITDIIRAWRERDSRENLSEEERELLPENPIGEVLSEEELLSVTGGRIKENGPTLNLC
jgi:mersacidin/lichenicidin family type 2 lantibiotic